MTRFAIRTRSSIHRVPRALALVSSVALATSVSVAVDAGVGPAAADTLPPNCVAATAGVTCTFVSTGAVDSFVVPAGIDGVTIEAWGAQGGSASGGQGGHARGIVPVTPGETLTVRVGRQDGFNGGGGGAFVGGGASDVREGGDTLTSRVVVAGGGGGAGSFGNPPTAAFAGGAGGGTFGGSGGGSGGTPTSGGAGGTSQCVPMGFGVPPSGGNGTLGNGGPGASVSCGADPGGAGGGGGGGLYGGGGGGVTGNCSSLSTPCLYVGASGGGGSGFVTPSAADPFDEAGGHTGDGAVTISYAFPASFTSQYATSEVPWVYVDALFLHDANLADVQHRATLFLASLGGILEANGQTPASLGSNPGSGGLSVTSDYTAGETAQVLRATSLFSTDGPTFQRQAVALLAYLVLVSGALG